MPPTLTALHFQNPSAIVYEYMISENTNGMNHEQVSIKKFVLIFLKISNQRAGPLVGYGEYRKF
jgi:hypothetical protein